MSIMTDPHAPHYLPDASPFERSLMAAAWADKDPDRPIGAPLELPVLVPSIPDAVVPTGDLVDQPVRDAVARIVGPDVPVPERLNTHMARSLLNRHVVLWHGYLRS